MASCQYDANHRIQSVTIVNGSQIIAAYTCAHDAVGNVIAVKDALKNTESDYKYDAMTRLISETTGGQTSTYTYDPLGNMKTRNVDSTTTTFDYNQANQLTDVNEQVYKYDANGNLTNDWKYNYKWNTLGQLVEVDNLSGVAMAIYT